MTLEKNFMHMKQARGQREHNVKHMKEARGQQKNTSTQCTGSWHYRTGWYEVLSGTIVISAYGARRSSQEDSEVQAQSKTEGSNWDSHERTNGEDND